MATGTVGNYPLIEYVMVSSNSSKTVARPSWAKFCLVIKTNTTQYVTLTIEFNNGQTRTIAPSNYQANMGGQIAANLTTDVKLMNTDQYSGNNIDVVVIFF